MRIGKIVYHIIMESYILLITKTGTNVSDMNGENLGAFTEGQQESRLKTALKLIKLELLNS